MLLTHGLQTPHTVLNSYIQTFTTGFVPTDGDDYILPEVVELMEKQDYPITLEQSRAYIEISALQIRSNIENSIVSLCVAGGISGQFNTLLNQIYLPDSFIQMNYRTAC